MDNLPIEVIKKFYDYDSTYRDVFNKVMVQLRCHFFIYKCHECCKPWNKCFCYCDVCRTYLKFCHQLYFDENDTYEDETSNIIQLGF